MLDRNVNKAVNSESLNRKGRILNLAFDLVSNKSMAGKSDQNKSSLLRDERSKIASASLTIHSDTLIKSLF